MPEQTFEYRQRPHLPEAKVFHDTFYQYGGFMDDIDRIFGGDPHLQVEQTVFKNGNSWLQVVLGTKGKRSDLDTSPRYKAIVPFWLSTQFGDDAKVLQAVTQTLSSLTYSKKNRPPLVDEVIGISPYFEMRQDKDGGDEGNKNAGESIDAQISAHALSKFKKIVLMGPHSNEGVGFIKDEGIDVLTLTSAPVVTEHIKEHVFVREGLSDVENEKRILPENTRIVALDKGSVQQCLHLSKLLNLNPADSIIAFDKKRKGHNMVADSALIYGDPKDIEGKDIVIYDDIIDTFDSMGKTCKSLKELYHCKSITVIATHGVLSYPARQNILEALDPNGNGKKVVDRIIMTDTLPRAKYTFNGIEGVTILKVGNIMGGFGHLFADCDMDQLLGDDYLNQFILDPIDKEVVWRYFRKFIAQKEKIQKLLS